MNKTLYNKYHKEVKDKEGNIIKVGDIVILHDSWYHTIHRGIVTHFTDKNVMTKHIEGKWVIKSQRVPCHLIKVADGYEDFPELGNLLSGYAKTMYEKIEKDYEISSMQ